jgi:hypothetical protein
MTGGELGGRPATHSAGHPTSLSIRVGALHFGWSGRSATDSRECAVTDPDSYIDDGLRPFLLMLRYFEAENP